MEMSGQFHDESPFILSLFNYLCIGRDNRTSKISN
jgi:hypothetical protein